MKEILSLHIGQAGVQVGNAIWELICAEHGVTETGYLSQPSRDIECLDTFFSESQSGRLIPRSIFVDLEASVIDEVKRGSFKTLFHPDRLISGPEDAASNFARGFFTVGKLLLGIVSHEIKRLLESAESTQAILIYRSLGGGTGSGLTSAIFDSLADYPKLVKMEIPIYPSPTLSTAMVEPYNCLLGEHFCMEDIDVGLLLDNEALYDICSKYLTVNYPTYTTINRLVSQVISSITASVRFESVMNCDITVIQTNLVPYPRIHFPLANYAPILCAVKAIHEELTVLDLTRAVFEKENQMMKIDHSFGRFMSCSLLYRGEVSPYTVYMALNTIKQDKNIEFVDWCPTGFKVGINICGPTVIPASEIYPTSKNVAMLANTSAVGQAWQRLTHKFYLLYSKRSFVHWFVGEGMEECEFTEALYNISALVKDYEEVTLDRNFEQESPAEDTIAEKIDQSNTGFTEVRKSLDKDNKGTQLKTLLKEDQPFEKEAINAVDDNENLETNDDEQDGDGKTGETEDENQTSEEQIIVEENAGEDVEETVEENAEEVTEENQEIAEESPEEVVEAAEEVPEEILEEALNEPEVEFDEKNEIPVEDLEDVQENDPIPIPEETTDILVMDTINMEVVAEEVQENDPVPENVLGIVPEDLLVIDPTDKEAAANEIEGDDPVPENVLDILPDITEETPANIVEAPEEVQEEDLVPEEIPDMEEGEEVDDGQNGTNEENGEEAVEVSTDDNGEDNADEADGENAENETNDEENADNEEDDNDENAENDEDENQNNNYIDKGETSNNYGYILDKSHDCFTNNDSTQSNFKTSLIKDNMIIRKFYSTFK